MVDGYSTNEDQGAVILPPPANDTSSTLWRLFNLTATRSRRTTWRLAWRRYTRTSSRRCRRLAELGDPANGYYGPADANMTVVGSAVDINGTMAFAPWE